MASITTRAGKGSPLTNAEVDANFTNLNTELASKQDALVSGTSIKTVNGQSVLGSGNIQIDGGVVSFNTRTGAITLTSGDVTDALGYTPVNKAGDTITGNIELSGTARLSVGIAASSTTGVRIGRGISGGTSANAITQVGNVQSDVTGTAVSFNSQVNTAAAAFTLTTFQHFLAQQGTIGAGSAVTNMVGFNADASLSGSTATYGYRGQLASGAGRWNLFMDGTAQNFVSGNLLIGSSSLANGKVVVGGNLTGQALMSAVRTEMTIQSDVTTGARGFQTLLGTQAASFTLPDIIHYRAVQGTFGAGSTVSSQNAFVADASLIGAGTNIGFRGAIPSGSNRWNLFMDGTAANFLAGGVILNNNLGVGASGSPSYGTSGQVLTSQGAGAAPTWTTVSAGGGATAIAETAATISTNYSIAAGNNGFSVGPVTIAAGASVTVPSGRSWLVTSTTPPTGGNIATSGKAVAMAIVFGA